MSEKLENEIIDNETELLKQEDHKQEKKNEKFETIGKRVQKMPLPLLIGLALFFFLCVLIVLAPALVLAIPFLFFYYMYDRKKKHIEIIQRIKAKANIKRGFGPLSNV